MKTLSYSSQDKKQRGSIVALFDFKPHTLTVSTPGHVYGSQGAAYFSLFCTSLYGHYQYIRYKRWTHTVYESSSFKSAVDKKCIWQTQFIIPFSGLR